MTMPSGAAVICLGSSGRETAERLAASLPDAAVHGLARRVDAEVPFDDTMEHLATLFAAGVPIVGVCAAGILIRAVAPLLDNKLTEGPVVAVSEDGASAVPLLGGHHGANALARHCAEVLGGAAAITTAGDVRFSASLDAPPAGWCVADPAIAKNVMAAMLAGEVVALEVEAGDASWLTTSDLPFGTGGKKVVRVTDRVASDDGALVLHPPVLAVGVGCERDCAVDELVELVRSTLATAGLTEAAIACVTSIDLKADEVAVIAVADAFGVPLAFFDAARLERETSRLANPSEIVFAEVGCHGVSEASALAVVGGDGELIVTKTKSKRATCAVARAPMGIDPAAHGRPRGHLTLVGLGPGDAALRTPQASRAIAGASDVVGYGYYLDLAGPLMRGRTRHDFPLGEETERCRAALELAGQGKKVALLCSGDPGIYAMASLVFELLDLEDAKAWRGVGIDVVPGVSALQIASARAGAPFGHDFCVISLSDLLTPREVVLQRVKAAAEGDFAIAFYNPVSRRRRDLLELARLTLLEHRLGDTPVLIGRLLGREGEAMTHVTLDSLAVDDVDMMSVVLIGSSTTRRINHLGKPAVYTPRGYARKRET